MLNVLFFDTETNGLPTDRRALTSDVAKWPHILQISWTLKSYTETSSKTIETQTHYLRLPPNVPWNDESAKFHMIDKAAIAAGLDPREVLLEFMNVAKRAHVLVAHNLAFDKPVLRAACYRLNPSENFSWWPTLEYCTMESTKVMCKLPSKFARPGDPWKYPRLPELYSHLFGTEVSGVVLHTAEGDTAVLIQCFDELVLRRVVPFRLWFANLRVRLLRAEKTD